MFVNQQADREFHLSIRSAELRGQSPYEAVSIHAADLDIRLRILAGNRHLVLVKTEMALEANIDGPSLLLKVRPVGVLSGLVLRVCLTYFEKISHHAIL
ncbi:Uncharacterised protein [Pseudomonas aeruginosa]|nr:Uncharacterised protein [Pseudomonas aeruginosa]